MLEQVFISYRREGGDVTAKLICEALKNHGYTVFFDYDSISGGFFDERILESIETCNDFILVLPPHSLDRCTAEEDWVRKEIRYALELKKNIIPVMLPEFAFPPDLPKDIEKVAMINGVHFIMSYFEGVIEAITDRLLSKPSVVVFSNTSNLSPSEGLAYEYDDDLNGYKVSKGKCADTEIVIPSTYKGQAVVSIDEDGFRDCAAITRVILPSTIKVIGECAFNSCSLLDGITLPEAVTEIGKWAFYGCTSLKNITIPKNVKAIKKRSFADCTSLVRFTVDDRNPFYCDIQGHLFTKNKKTLVNYAVGKTDTHYEVPDGVTKIEDSAFSHNSYIQEIVLPNSVTAMGDFCFNDCPQLESITMPERMTELGESIFQDDTALTSIVIPEGITVLEDSALRGCTSLSRVTLPGTLCVMEKSVFYQCGALKSVQLPESLTDIGKWAFYKCNSLSGIPIPKNVRRIEPRAFSYCNNIAFFTVDSQNAYFCEQNGHLFTKNMDMLLSFAASCEKTDYTVPNGVVTIRECAFSECRTLKRVVLPQSVDQIESFAFDTCTSLESITMPDTMTELGQYAFRGCESLKKMTVPSGVTAICDRAFRGCTALQSVYLPDSVKSIGEDAFRLCTSLSELRLSPNIRSFDDGAFYDCSSLPFIHIPKATVEIGQWSFFRCASAKIVTIPRRLEKLDHRAFADCSSLERFKVSMFNRSFRAYGKHLYTKDMTGVLYFAGGSSDLEHVIPQGVTVIGDCAFSECHKLLSLTIPTSVREIKDFGINNCTSLKHIRYTGTTTEWKGISRDKNSLKKNLAKKITCSDGSISI